MTVKDFLDTNDFTKDQLLDMIELSRVLKRCVKAGYYPELLKHKTLGMIFQQVSTRTRLSFEGAMADLGGTGQFYAPGVYRLYLNGEEHPLPDDFCAQGGVLAYSLPDEHPHATTAHRQFSYVEPTQGGILLEHGDTPRKYTVYAIGTDGRMIVGDVTV